MTTSVVESEGVQKRVAFVINHLGRGGAETQMVRLAIETQASGHAVKIFTMMNANDFEETLSANGVEVCSLGMPSPRSIPFAALRLVRAFRAWPPDVTVAFLFQATLTTRLANLFARPFKRISSIRNERLETRLRAIVFRATCGLDHHIVANSQTAMQKLQESRTIPTGRRATVIYNGVDVDRLRRCAQVARDDTRSALGIGRDDFVFLGVGRLSAQKDWATLVEAVARYGDCSATRWLVAGQGEQGPELKDLCSRLGVDQHVQFLGLRDDVDALLAAADCLVLCSRYEGTPNVVLEALAIGTPIIATRVGACAELVGPGDGILVAPSSPKELAAAMRTQATGFEDRRHPASLQVGQRAAHNVDRYSWHQVAPRWLYLMGLHVQMAGAVEGQGG